MSPVAGQPRPGSASSRRAQPVACVSMGARLRPRQIAGCMSSPSRPVIGVPRGYRLRSPCALQPCLKVRHRRIRRGSTRAHCAPARTIACCHTRKDRCNDAGWRAPHCARARTEACAATMSAEAARRDVSSGRAYLSRPVAGAVRNRSWGPLRLSRQPLQRRYIRPVAALPAPIAPRRSTPTTTPSMMSGSSRRLTRMGSKSTFSGNNQTVLPSCL